MVRVRAWMMLTAVVLLAGCNLNGPQGQSGNDDPALAEGKKFLLESEPGGAKDVTDLRKTAKDGDEVVLVGHIAGSKKPFVNGRCSFAVLDLAIKPCPADEGCPTPWDCCCTPKEDLLPATAQVKFVGPDGKTIEVGAKEMFGIKELSTVVVKGKASRDDQGNLTVVGSGIFVRKDMP